MIPLTLAEVAEATDGRLVAGAATTRIDTVTTDSRDVAGDATLFIAIRGEHADGHDFIPDALDRGAAAVLSAEDVDAPADAGVVRVADTWTAIAALGSTVRDRVDPFVVAITGSVGKTTTKDLTGAALAAGRRTVAARGSFNNELGVPLTLLSLRPDSEALVVEIGARGVGHIAQLAPHARPDVAIVTAVAGVHLELFGSLDAVTQAKGELVESLADDGTAVLNADDERVATMAGRTRARVLRYGVGGDRPSGTAELDVTATDVSLDRLARASFTARTPWDDVRVDLPVAGRHHVSNALAALAAAGVAGVPIPDAAAALASAPVSSWRGEVRESGGLVILNDAYNANPTSMAAAVAMLGDVERTGRAVAVLGVMAEIGDTSDDEHAALGRRVAEADVDVVVVGADAAAIARGARAAGLPEDRLAEVADADEALDHLRGRVGRGDVVLVKASRVAGLERVADGLSGSGLDGEAHA